MSGEIKDPPKNTTLTHQPAKSEHGKAHRPSPGSPKASHPLPQGGEGSARPADHYNPEKLNTVLKNLKALVTFKTEKGFELAAKQQQHAAKMAHPKGPMILKDGKLMAAGHQDNVGAGSSRPGEGTSPLQTKKDDLTPFEQVFLARFEEGQKLGEPLEKGRRARFLEKTESGWKEFFQRFLPFTQRRTVKIADLEAMIYRGIMRTTSGVGAGSSRPGTGTAPLLISDLKFITGKTDKFARLEIQGSALLQTLSENLPGDVLAQALIAELIGGPELAYLTLSHRVVNPEMMKESGSSIALAYKSPEEMKGDAIREGTRQATLGIALSAKTEQLIAERLDLNLRASPRQDNVGVSGGRPGEGTSPLQGKGRKKGLFGLFGGDLFGDDSLGNPVFVPWYQHMLRFKKYPGKVKWWVPLLYFVGASAIVLSTFYIFKFLAQR